MNAPPQAWTASLQPIGWKATNRWRPRWRTLRGSPNEDWGLHSGRASSSQLASFFAARTTTGRRLRNHGGDRFSATPFADGHRFRRGSQLFASDGWCSYLGDAARLSLRRSQRFVLHQFLLSLEPMGLVTACRFSFSLPDLVSAAGNIFVFQSKRLHSDVQYL